MAEFQSKPKPIGVIEYFKIYFSNPIQGMKLAPDWHWPTLLSVQLITNVFFALISDALSKNSITFVKKIFILPFSSIVTCFFGACFFYFLFLFLYNREISFHRTYTLVFLALIPFLVLRILSPLIAPINLIGFAITSIFLTVGFVENFQLPKKSIIKLFSLVFFLYFVSWSAQQIFFSKKELRFMKESESNSNDMDQNIEDVDKIEDEVNKSL